MEISNSENWALLLKLLKHDSGQAQQNNGNIFEHQQAYALANFLVEATLATPELNRSNVADLIAGELGWPISEGSKVYPGSQYSLKFFEDGGFISFPGGWAEVHCWNPKQTNKIDQSIEDIIGVINLLNNIRFGLEGYIQPHFEIEEAPLTDILSKKLGDININRLLPGATQQCGKVTIYPDKQQFTELESTYLWQCLLERHPPEHAFQQWMICVRVFNNSIIPVQFNLLNEMEIDIFLSQVELLLKTAPEFSYELKTIHKQAVNSYNFAHLIQPQKLEINLNIGGKNITQLKTHEPDEHPHLKLITAESLDNAYRFHDIEDPEEIFTLGRLQHWESWREPMGVFSGLINACLNHSIIIDYNSLIAKPFSLNLLSLAESSQALKVFLFITLPHQFNSKYILFLLSRPEACEIAIYHLTNREFTLPLTHRHDMSDELNRLFLDVLMGEYVRTIKKRPDNGLKLLNLSLHLADNSGLYNFVNTDGFQYRALTCLMQKIEDEHICALSSAFIETISEQYERRILHIRERSVYLLGLWLLQRYESSAITYNDFRKKLGECLVSFYSNAFKDCINTRRRDLECDEFFALLPWQSLLKAIEISDILKISIRFRSWDAALTYESDRCFDALSAIRQYLQLLMLISKGVMEETERSRIWKRIIDIVCTYGFGNDKDKYYLFSNVINDKAEDLWKMFSLFANNLPQSLYEDFIQSSIEMIPLDSLYILLERCNIPERKQDIRNAIVSRQDLKDGNLGLKSLETAFIYACENSDLQLAGEILSSAKPLLERFKDNTHKQFKETVSTWETYSYKYRLLSIYNSCQEDPDAFEREVLKVSFPVSFTESPWNEINRRCVKDCEKFRRYIIAMAFFKIDPSKTVQYMEALCSEDNAPHFALALFRGHVAELSDSQDHDALRRALNKFLEQTSNIKPDQMASSWVAMVLEVMVKVGDQQRADEYWRKLSGEQHRTLEILLPYCKGLIYRSKPLIASQIINEYREYNSVIEHNVGLSELITQLSQALPNQNTVFDLMTAIAESHQRSIEQLKQHYKSIIGRKFEDYVKITGDGRSKEIYLKEIITDVAGELLLRKKNLQSQKTKDGVLNKIIGEDLINDWFTSLVDMRLAEARIGFRDQKRTGSSASGKSPGESDSLITDSQNRRIAVFEAFRLFSTDTTVINEHLNKISGYDAEALSPVFMVAYCDVKDFSSLTTNYHKFISEIDYDGYQKKEPTVIIDKELTTDNIFICKEIRLRGEREVMFYHLLLNMYCN